MILTRIYGYLCIVLLITTLSFGALWQHEQGRKNAILVGWGKQHVAALIAAREAERKHALELDAIAKQYEKDKKDAETAQTQLVTALRAGTVRLRNLWQGCQATGRVSGAAASAAESDAAARDREESAARIVRAARDADDTIKRLQDVARKDRE